jgi:peptidoglycan L-alanyl-D-glutamate endopeptidase CwlK
MTERSRKMIAELNPQAQPVFTDFLTGLDNFIGENQYIVFEGRRTVRVQEAYYAQGRKSLEEVNALRKLAGLYLLRSDKDNYVITWTLKSKHIDGLAMDVLPVDGAGNPTWDLAHYWHAFERIRSCGDDTGLVCGGDWPSPLTDWPHYEVRG